MNEQLVMDLANNITWLVLLCLVGGMLIGWYATFTHYRQKESDYKLEGQKEMHDKCMKNFIEGAAKVVKDTDLAMKALGIDEETQKKIRRAREIVHKAHCADLPVPDKIVIRKETEPQPPSFEESQGEKKKED